MRRVLGSLPQMFVMATVVASLFLIPVAGVLALACFFFFGISIRGFVTFGESLPAPEGLVAWWLLMLVPALVYSAYVMPWSAKDEA